MKLFVWVNPYKVPWGTSLLMAVAETEEAARTIARTSPGYLFGNDPITPHRNVELGSPTRVVELPCAEWHECGLSDRTSVHRV